MPFYLYGTRQQKHISHILLRAPNIALSAGNVTFSPELPEKALQNLSNGLILKLTEKYEAAMQPFPTKNKDLPRHFFFRGNQKFKVKVYYDKKDNKEGGPDLLQDLEEVEYDGELTLNLDVDVDAEGPNKDELYEASNVDSTKWQEELDKIGNVLNSKDRKSVV